MFKYLVFGISLMFVSSVNAMDMYVGANTGNTYSLYAGAFAKVFEKHIRQKVTVKNLPGAGGLILYKRMNNEELTPPDGNTIAMIPSQLIFQQIAMMRVGDKDYIDPSKFKWIGSLSSDNTILVVNKQSEIKTVQDLKTKPVLFAGTGAAHDAVIMGKILTESIPLKNAKVVQGYKSFGEINLALERNEVNSIALMTLDTLLYQRTEKYNNGEIVPIVQYSRGRDDRIKNVPSIYEILSSEKDKRVVEYLTTPFVINRTIFTSRNVDPGKMKQIRLAFSKTVLDTEYIKIVEKFKLGNHPRSGFEIEKIISDSVSVDKDIAKRYMIVRSQ